MKIDNALNLKYIFFRSFQETTVCSLFAHTSKLCTCSCRDCLIYNYYIYLQLVDIYSNYSKGVVCSRFVALSFATGVEIYFLLDDIQGNV